MISSRSSNRFYFSIFVVAIIVLLSTQSTTGFISKTRLIEEDSNYIIDLSFSSEMYDAEVHYQRLVILPSGNWDKLVLKMIVQNFGESLDNVFISVRNNEETIECIFKTYEQSGLRNSLTYQFEQAQELIIPLNVTNQEQVLLSLTVMLDSLISWREPVYNFSILSTSLHCINFVQPEENIQRLPVFSPSHTYVVQPSKISLFSKKILSKCFVPILIPDGMELNALLNITMVGASFDFLSLGFGANSANGGSKVQINTTIQGENLNEQFWELHLYFLPYFSSSDEFVSITIDVEVLGIMNKITTSNDEYLLSSHPVPGLIMIPLLIFTLFGIPYYYVYQEELTEKNDQILEHDEERI